MSRTARPCGHREVGAASILALSVVAVLLVFTMGGLVVGSVVVASGRARTAADLGSLAGASALQEGASPDRACATARWVVHANRAAMRGCSVAGPDIELRVTTGAGLWPQPATARARAGPER